MDQFGIHVSNYSHSSIDIPMCIVSKDFTTPTGGQSEDGRFDFVYDIMIAIGGSTDRQMLSPIRAAMTHKDRTYFHYHYDKTSE